MVVILDRDISGEMVTIWVNHNNLTGRSRRKGWKGGNPPQLVLLSLFIPISGRFVKIRVTFPRYWYGT